MSASGPPPALPAARSPAGETLFLVDAHVHLHPCFDRADFLDGALSNFERAADERGLPPGWRACLLFAETRGETLFHEARQGPIASPGRGWEIEPAGEPGTLVARRPGGGEIILIGGRQLRSAEGIEVLALASGAEVAGGLPLGSLVDAVIRSGAVAVLPWGLGKWWGSRGRAVERFLGSWSGSGSGLFLGDNAGRPALAPRPRIFELAASRGVLVLPGSDPLPLPGQARRAGRYGFLLCGAPGSDPLARGLRSLIGGLRSQPPSFGRRENLIPVLTSAAALRARRLFRGRHRPGEPASIRVREPPPDLESSSDGYALRFRGPAGAWFLERQESAVLDLLSGLGPSLRILEVGGGHAQLTPALVAAGHRVTVQGSSPSCSVRLRRLLDSSRAPFVVGSLEELPFADQAFDVVVSIRMLAHVAAADTFLASCARVSGRAILLDFPSTRSVNALGGALWRIKKGIEKDTRPFRCFRPGEPEALLARHGFRRARSVVQFFLPMALHRLHDRRGLARLLEAAPRRLGLTALLGSPVLALYIRKGARVP